MKDPAHLATASAIGLLSAVLLLTGCATQPANETSTQGAPLAGAESNSPQPTAKGADSAQPEDKERVPGYDVGAFPPVPLFELPDLSLLDSSAPAFTISTSKALSDIGGVSVQPAHCDASGEVAAGRGAAYLYGDGAGNYTGPDGTIQNFGDGSGNTTINGTAIQNFGDGSGNYSDGTVTIQNFGDGSGNYTDSTKTIQIQGDGSGNYSDGAVTIQNFGDGSGNYTDGAITIQNFGDGSGNYTDGSLVVRNNGDGTGQVNGRALAVAPIAPVPRLGSFPPLAALAPISSCGTLITFHDGVLFDFDRSDIRPDAVSTLAAVARVLSSADIPEARVEGHTDAIGSDSANMALSEARAQAVVAALSTTVATRLIPEGFGESQPVAPNEIDGKDNPAGRQLNRRVEIFIPTAS